MHNSQSHARRSTDQGCRGWSAVDQRSRVPNACRARAGAARVYTSSSKHETKLTVLKVLIGVATPARPHLSAHRLTSGYVRSHSRGKMPALSISDVTHIWQRGLGTCYVTTFARGLRGAHIVSLSPDLGNGIRCDVQHARMRTNKMVFISSRSAALPPQ